MATQVTLYIEDTDIKLLVTRNRQIEKWASLLLEPGLVSDGVILDEDQVAQKIKELLKLQGVREKRVIAALSGLNSIFRVISLPELPQAILPEAIKNEANRVIPMPLEQTYLGHQILPSPPGETRVFLVAFPRNATDALIKTMAKAGLRTHLLDIAPLALSRCADVPRAIIVNSWLSNIDIVIMADRVPRVIRSLSLPTESVSLKEKLPSITEELDRTVAFYNSSQAERKLDSSVPVFVCGDLAKEPDSWPQLVGKHNFPVSALPSPMSAPEAFDTSQFMVNVGLALKELLPATEGANFSLVNFNALPEVYLPRGVSIINIMAPIVGVIAIGGLVFGGFFVLDMRAETADLRSQLATAEGNLVQQRAEIAVLQGQADQLETAIQPVETTESALNKMLIDLGLDRANVTEDLKEAVYLLNLRPNNTVNLTELNYGGNSLTIRGTAADEDDIFTYARDLENSGRFPLVVILSITADTIGEEGEEIKVFDFEFLLK